MAVDAHVGGFRYQRGDGASPEEFTNICAVFDGAGLGEKRDQVDATTFCSDGQKEYIAGLADGNDFTLQMLWSQDDEQILALINDVQTKATRNFHVVDMNSSPNLTFELAVTALNWEVKPSVSGRNEFVWGGKISGGILLT